MANGRSRRRSPHGGRGLKLVDPGGDGRHELSLPARGAWIETGTKRIRLYRKHSRSPHGGRGLKHSWMKAQYRKKGSLPARGAWIETNVKVLPVLSRLVAPRT